MALRNAGEHWPIYHVTALDDEGCAMPYDANGCIFWNGRYHLMYIYQDPALGDAHCWGHASSADLINWTFHPAALKPLPGDADAGIFSGNAFVNKNGVPMLCWFGLNAGVCVATAEDDDLIRWKKHPANPLIPCPKEGEPGFGKYTVWDPYLWLEGNTYFCLLGGNRLPNGKDTLYFAKSPDLVNWTYVGPFYEHPDLSWTRDDEDCSCPDFFALGTKHVLLCISHPIGARAYVGRFVRDHFYPEQHVRMNWPGSMYFAPESLAGPRGRRIFWAWVTDPRIRPTQNKTGSGFQSLPRVMSLAPDDTLLIQPAEELSALRREHSACANITARAGEDIALDKIRGDAMEIDAEIDPSGGAVGIKVRCSPDGSEETAVWFDPTAKTLSIDMSRSSTRDDVTYGSPPFASYNFNAKSDNPAPFPKFDAPFEIRQGEKLQLRIFLDKPMLEVFANGRQCVTQVIFPASPDSLGVKFCAKDKPARLARLDCWQMAPLTIIDQRR